MKMLNLSLHCGAQEVPYETLREVPTPAPTRTHVPIPHAHLVDLVKECFFTMWGIPKTMYQEAFGVTPDGNRMFGVMRVGNTDDHACVLGIRNSHDKSFPAGYCVGSQVFVCDNMAFSADHTFRRKHTVHILRDLPNIIHSSMLNLGRHYRAQEIRFGMYKDTPLDDRDAAYLAIGGHRKGAYGSLMIPRIIDQWYSPNHEEFAPRTAWSYFNAVTEALKGPEGGRLMAGGSNTLDRQTIKATGFLDEFLGIPDKMADMNLINHCAALCN